ncbi:MAG: TIGR00282 family metallophosphoesterase [Bacilli bacterium]
MNILIIGDVFSKLGRKILENNINKIKEEKHINFVIINGENISHGKGINEGHYKWLMTHGANVVTLGNHTYQNKSILNIMENTNNLVRPCNYPESSPGTGYCTMNYNGIKITVFQVIGELFMKNPENTTSFFKATEELLGKVKSDIYICDFHGEATSEKVAYGLYNDGKIQVIYGTHTHVPTNDLRILPKGTAYISDVGMTGPLNAVIGVKAQIIFDRMIKEKTHFFDPEDEGEAQLNGIVVEINEKTYKVEKVEQIQIFEK